MGAVRVLEPHVANQIAAGEVVERPASVVKELIENALDAGASRVEIEVRAGGADLIRVADDGSGMEREDALLALERHATSKIRRAEDLKAIATFGFRGEALPSIASVSSLRLLTSTGGPSGGTLVHVGTGTVERVEPVSHPRGTTIEVERLFQNAPARRKFLRSPAAETARIADIVGTIAAAHPAIAFTLTSAGRQILAAPPAGTCRDRAADLLGRQSAALLLPIETRDGGVRLTGLVSAPALSRSTSRDERLYVNGRAVRDRRVLHAVHDAYATLLPRGRYPVVYLFLEVPSSDVDVNVHPAKSEVRFLRPGAIHGLVRRTLVEALRASRPTQALAPPPRSVSEAAPQAGAWSSEALPQAGVRGQEPGLDDRLPLSTLAQFRDSYILAAAPDGLVIVDQHAAHERVLYERLLKDSLARRVERQRLLLPLTVEVTAAQRAVFEEASEALESLGFTVTAFGEAVLRVDEVPAVLPIGNLDRLVVELLDEFLEWHKMEGIDRLRHLIASTAACHAAVTARHPLQSQEMERIVADLMRAESPMTCPHGRPVLLRLTLDRLEREFRRK